MVRDSIQRSKIILDTLSAFLIRPFYKLILGENVELEDIEKVDETLYNSLKYIK